MSWETVPTDMVRRGAAFKGLREIIKFFDRFVNKGYLVTYTQRACATEKVTNFLERAHGQGGGDL